MTKTAQLAVAHRLAENLAGTGITVNSVLLSPQHLGGTLVAEVAAGRGVNPKSIEQAFFVTARPSSILQCFSTTEGIAAMIAYVCSERASATTGTALRGDGGEGGVRVIT
ncbi:SDR family oxidoreductase [Pectobacteriaceae bacterium CE90]|nr:SDR family oxidoreductase [Pectobacteriaceae bacterium CE90]